MVDRYGFGSIKLKGGVFPPAEEIDAIRALREAFPDHPLRLDPNAAWTVRPRSRSPSRPRALEYLEDPTPGIAGMAPVAQGAPMPLATNMCIVTRRTIPSAVRPPARRDRALRPPLLGRAARSAELAAICRTWGVGVSMHSNIHLGISLAAMTHLGGALPELTYAGDTHPPWQGGVIVPSPLSIVDGAVRVPDGPGLGVELDRDALARLHENYLRCGVRVRDDLTYIRTVQPDFEPRIARW